MARAVSAALAGVASEVSFVKVTPIPHGLELNKPASGTVRGAGLHISAIYNDLYQSLEPERYRRDSTPDPLRLEAGLAFEEMLEEALTKRLTEDSGRPGELVSEEGILYSPDLIIFNGSTRVGEIKLSWLSTKELPTEPSNSLPPKFDKYCTQMMSYCHCLGTPLARLYFFGINGDYRHPYTPQLLAFDIEFSARELQESWTMLMNHARQRRMR